ncbi:acetyl-CoA carboxylase biotin carboxyl carrier protein subunit, partial [Sulfitobacter sp. 15WGC]|uniref:acetyl-CoA carboxylase biotin carboxyl carrier protein n=1 Tax=Sulfitobacter sp. 15WGC TaxID=2575437 RepID=UPI0024A99A6B
LAACGGGDGRSDGNFFNPQEIPLETYSAEQIFERGEYELTNNSTVYLQAEPGAPAFISVGASVSEGDTLLIVEAMKTMNHIPAPRAGTVKRILVGDGDAVEFGAPLVILE